MSKCFQLFSTITLSEDVFTCMYYVTKIIIIISTAIICCYLCDCKDVTVITTSAKYIFVEK